MDNGTRIRTALAIALALYTAFLKTDVTDFGNDTVNLIYQICMKVVTFVVIFLITYYNNDYTEAACYGTGITRQLKAEMREDYEGERFFIDEDGEPMEALFEGEEEFFEEEAEEEADFEEEGDE